jgi:hypothetical protein
VLEQCKEQESESNRDTQASSMAAQCVLETCIHAGFTPCAAMVCHFGNRDTRLDSDGEGNEEM